MAGSGTVCLELLRSSEAALAELLGAENVTSGLAEATAEALLPKVTDSFLQLAKQTAAEQAARWLGAREAEPGAASAATGLPLANFGAQPSSREPDLSEPLGRDLKENPTGAVSVQVVALTGGNKTATWTGSLRPSEPDQSPPADQSADASPEAREYVERRRPLVEAIAGVLPGAGHARAALSPRRRQLATALSGRLSRDLNTRALAGPVVRVAMMRSDPDSIPLQRQILLERRAKLDPGTEAYARVERALASLGPDRSGSLRPSGSAGGPSRSGTQPGTVRHRDASSSDEERRSGGRHIRPRLLGPSETGQRHPAPAAGLPGPGAEVTALIDGLTRAGRPIRGQVRPGLGPDLFGSRQAPNAPGFMSGVYQDEFAVDQVVPFLRAISMTNEARPTAESLKANRLRPEPQTITTATFSGRSNDPLQPTNGRSRVPRLAVAIWLGGPPNLQRQEWRGLEGIRRALGPDVAMVLLTDVPRAQIEAARHAGSAGGHVPAGQPGRDAAERARRLGLTIQLLEWAVRHKVLLVNVDEISYKGQELTLDEAYRAELARHTGYGYTRASDILRFSFAERFGALLYTDWDNAVKSGFLNARPGALLDSLERLFAQRGYALQIDDQGEVNNNTFIAGFGHPFPKAVLRQITARYTKTQRELYEAVDLPYETVGDETLGRQWFTTPEPGEGDLRLFRRSILLRTGPAAAGAATKGVSAPSLTQLDVGYANSWEGGDPLLAERVFLPEEVTEVVRDMAATLVRDLYNREGDLRLTVAAPVIAGLPDPDVGWQAVTGYILSRQDLRGLVTRVTDRQTWSANGRDMRTRVLPLPAGVRAALGLPDVQNPQGGWLRGELARPTDISGSRQGETPVPDRGNHGQRAAIDPHAREAAVRLLVQQRFLESTPGTSVDSGENAAFIDEVALALQEHGPDAALAAAQQGARERARRGPVVRVQMMHADPGSRSLNRELLQGKLAELTPGTPQYESAKRALDSWGPAPGSATEEVQATEAASGSTQPGRSRRPGVPRSTAVAPQSADVSESPWLLKGNMTGIAGGKRSWEGEHHYRLRINGKSELSIEEARGYIRKPLVSGLLFNITIEIAQFIRGKDENYYYDEESALRAGVEPERLVYVPIPEFSPGLMGVLPGEGASARDERREAAYIAYEEKLSSLSRQSGDEASMVPLRNALPSGYSWSVTDLGRVTDIARKPVPGGSVAGRTRAQHNVGVPLAGIRALLEYVLPRTWHQGGKAYLGGGLAFGDELAARYPRPAGSESSQEIAAEEAEILAGVGALAYVGAAAMAHHLLDPYVIPIKGHVAVLARHDMGTLLNATPGGVQDFFRENKDLILNTFVAHFSNQMPHYEEDFLKNRGGRGPVNILAPIPNASEKPGKYLLGEMRQGRTFGMNTLARLDVTPAGEPQAVLEIRSFDAGNVGATSEIEANRQLAAVVYSGERLRVERRLARIEDFRPMRLNFPLGPTVLAPEAQPEIQTMLSPLVRSLEQGIVLRREWDMPVPRLEITEFTYGSDPDEVAPRVSGHRNADAIWQYLNDHLKKRLNEALKPTARKRAALTSAAAVSDFVDDLMPASWVRERNRRYHTSDNGPKLVRRVAIKVYLDRDVLDREFVTDVRNRLIRYRSTSPLTRASAETNQQIWRIYLKYKYTPQIGAGPARADFVAQVIAREGTPPGIAGGAPTGEQPSSSGDAGSSSGTIRAGTARRRDANSSDEDRGHGGRRIRPRHRGPSETQREGQESPAEVIARLMRGAGLGETQSFNGEYFSAGSEVASQVGFEPNAIRMRPFARGEQRPAGISLANERGAGFLDSFLANALIVRRHPAGFDSFLLQAGQARYADSAKAGLAVVPPWHVDTRRGGTFFVGLRGSVAGENGVPLFSIGAEDGGTFGVAPAVLARLLLTDPAFAEAMDERAASVTMLGWDNGIPATLAAVLATELEDLLGRAVSVYAGTGPVIVGPGAHPHRDFGYIGVGNGGHWHVSGYRDPDHDSAIASELASALSNGWRYAQPPRAGLPVDDSDRYHTLKIARKVLKSIQAGLGEEPGVLSLRGAADLAKEHARPYLPLLAAVKFVTRDENVTPDEDKSTPVTLVRDSWKDQTDGTESRVLFPVAPEIWTRLGGTPGPATDGGRAVIREPDATAIGDSLTIRREQDQNPQLKFKLDALARRLAEAARPGLGGVAEHADIVVHGGVPSGDVDVDALRAELVSAVQGYLVTLGIDAPGLAEQVILSPRQAAGDAAGPRVEIAARSRADLVLEAYPWLAQVNPGRGEGGGYLTNCVLAAIAVDTAMATGVVEPITSSKGYYWNEIATWAKSNGVPFSRVGRGLGAIIDAMGEAQPGAKALVLVNYSKVPGHAFNVVRHARLGVVFLDGQMANGDPLRIVRAYTEEPVQTWLVPTTRDREVLRIGVPTSSEEFVHAAVESLSHAASGGVNPVPGQGNHDQLVAPDPTASSALTGRATGPQVLSALVDEGAMVRGWAAALRDKPGKSEAGTGGYWSDSEETLVGDGYWPDDETPTGKDEAPGGQKGNEISPAGPELPSAPGLEEALASEVTGQARQASPDPAPGSRAAAIAEVLRFGADGIGRRVNLRDLATEEQLDAIAQRGGLATLDDVHALATRVANAFTDPADGPDGPPADVPLTLSVPAGRTPDSIVSGAHIVAAAAAKLKHPVFVYLEETGAEFKICW